MVFFFDQENHFLTRIRNVKTKFSLRHEHWRCLSVLLSRLDHHNSSFECHYLKTCEQNPFQKGKNYEKVGAFHCICDILTILSLTLIFSAVSYYFDLS